VKLEGAYGGLDLLVFVSLKLILGQEHSKTPSSSTLVARSCSVVAPAAQLTATRSGGVLCPGIAHTNAVMNAVVVCLSLSQILKHY
jgi:hypothetical protein